MARLDRYILVQLLWIFGFFSLVLVSVYWVNRAVRLFDQLVSDGQPVSVFLEFTILSLPMMIRTVLPISAFVAATYVTYSLMRSSEIAALQAAGVSATRLARPVIVFGLIVSAFLLVLMHVLIPEARSQLSRRQAEVAQNFTAGLLQDGVFQHPAEGVTFFINEITPEGVLRGIYLSDARSTLRRVDYTARTALIVPEATGPKLVMIDGLAQVHDETTGRLSVTGFGDFTYDLGVFAQAGAQRRNVQELSTRALWSPSAADLESTGATPAILRFELVTRFTDAFAALGTALIGFAALIAGGFNRLGFWREILMAVALMAFLQILGNALSGFALRSASMAWVGLVPLTVALALSYALMRWSMRRRRVRA